MNEKTKQERFADLAPKLTEGEHEAINGLFRAFIFRRRSTDEYWTTCCREHVVLDRARTVTPEMRAIIDCESAPEPHMVGCWLSGRRLENEHSHDRLKCPHCGREVTVKELGRTGQRQNLTSWGRAVVLKWYRGALWAVGYSASKDYSAPCGPLTQLDKLTNLPKVKKFAVLRLRPGCAERTYRDWWYSGDDWWPIMVQKEPRKKGLPFQTAEVFAWTAEYGKSYDVIGWEELDRSPFRYVGIREIKEKTGVEAMRLLVMACFFSRQMEMLHKFGLDRCIEDYTDRNKKNAWLLDWKAEDPRRFCRLPAKTVRAAAGDSNGMEALRIWKTNRQKDTLEDCRWLAEEIQNVQRREWVRARANAWDVRLGRIAAYLNDNTIKHHTIDSTVQMWQDYLEAAEALGLDMSSDVIRMPKDLKQAHDARCDTWTALKKRKVTEAERKAYEARYQKLVERYAFELNGLRILVPESAEQIIQEGKALAHCVGGYADRHLKGATTILFLRRAEFPNLPFVTVEINGAAIKQAHGYQNERIPSPDNPEQKSVRELYKDFFDVWTDWIKRGSPRKKNGSPRIKPRRRAEQLERKVS